MKKQSVHLLEELGFEPVGEWLSVKDALKVRFYSTQLRGAQKVLYAFVAGNQVLYLGKTMNRLDVRLQGYVHPGPSQKTNQRVHELLMQMLQNTPVSILVLVDKGQLQYKGIPVNLAAGLEDELIARLKPAWNIQGNSLPYLARPDSVAG